MELKIAEPMPDDSLFSFTSAEHKEVLRITGDRRVIVSGDIYEAAKVFWDVVIQIAPKGFSVEVS